MGVTGSAIRCMGEVRRGNGLLDLSALAATSLARDVLVRRCAGLALRMIPNLPVVIAFVAPACDEPTHHMIACEPTLSTKCAHWVEESGPPT